jgi:alpha-galactosidase
LPTPETEITAVRIESVDADGFPFAHQWGRAPRLSFDHDWQGNNPDVERRTEVRLLWNDEAMFVRFVCSYRSMTVFEDAGENGRRNELWDRDVAEVFLQPDRFGSRYYKEFEIAPNGYWLDLEITPEGLTHITSGMRRRLESDSSRQQWTAVLSLPFASLTWRFDPAQSWRVNFFRCEGAGPARFYSAWQPTHTPEPKFHVPEVFGTLRFAR